MTDLNTFLAQEYLYSRGFRGNYTISELGGGVSNTVLLAEAPHQRLVLKQALGRLRVAEEWLSDRKRLLREAAALIRLAEIVPPENLPRVLFVDEENCIYAMEAAPPEARTWKELLFSGNLRERDARTAGSLLGAIAAGSWNSPSCEAAFGDQTVFDQLRIDPYYRTAARRNQAAAGAIASLIEAMPRTALVHGDWSPKNFLIAGDRFLAIDFEVIHYGDPTFDIAFLLNHLLLKSLVLPDHRSGFAELAGVAWNAWSERVPDPATTRATAHLGALLLSRVDGKSPAEYLTSPALKQQARALAHQVLLDPPSSILEVFR